MFALTFLNFLRFSFIHRLYADGFFFWIHKYDIQREKKMIVQKCPFLLHLWSGPWIIHHGFLSLRSKCHMQVNINTSPSSSLPIMCLASAERRMELHVDISHNSSHNISWSAWMDNRFDLTGAGISRTKWSLKRFWWLWFLSLSNFLTPACLTRLLNPLNVLCSVTFGWHALKILFRIF